jgi:predicted nucleotidyltransferase
LGVGNWEECWEAGDGGLVLGIRGKIKQNIYIIKKSYNCMKKGYNLLILGALKYFIENPYNKVHLREFSRILKISPNSANRFLDLFLKEGFVIEERVANLRYFRANLKSVSFRQMKKLFCVKEIENSGLLDELKGVCFSLVLFGSCAKGVDDKNSDIDFVIITKNENKIKTIFKKYERKFNRELSLHIFSSLRWKKEKIENKAFYQDVVSSGINLIGEIPI